MRFWLNPETHDVIASNTEPDGHVETDRVQYLQVRHPSLYVYDIETYPNIFTCVAHHPLTRWRWRFEVSNRMNQAVELFQFLTSLRSASARMVGFNNLGFDYPVIHQLVARGGHVSSGDLYQKAQAIIDSTDRFEHLVWDSDQFVDQVDLYKIHHFDNKARSTGLKVIEFNMQAQNIEDLPFQPGVPVPMDQFDNLMSYNEHDVMMTTDFLFETFPMLDFRDQLSGQINRNFTNHNDTKIGKDYFIGELESRGVPCFTRVNGKRQPRQTPRDVIRLGDCILDWINFESIPFQLVATYLRNLSITKTKGVFEFLEVPFELAQYMNPSRIRVHGLTEGFTEYQRSRGINLTKLNIEDLRDKSVRFVSGWRDKSGMNCIIDGFTYVFGTGGIHGSIESRIVESDAHYALIDLDVKSYYPNLAIANDFYPEHHGRQFCDIYQDVYNRRKSFAKGTAENDMLKLALNGVYGDSNNPYSPFYDPAYTMTITLNGQLLLCLLAEYLMSINDLEMIQINTDGLTVKCPRDQVDVLMFLAKTWEQATGLELERADYTRMMIRDVNNYIAQYEDGTLKRKGAYCYGSDLAWHQNHSAQIVAMAAEAELVRGVPIPHTIHSHQDIIDFMICAKVPRSSKLMWGQELLQNTTRYLVTHTGQPLVKVMPPLENSTEDRNIGIDVGWLTTPCNDLSQLPENIDINHDYYIEQAVKLVEPLKTGAKQTTN